MDNETKDGTKDVINNNINIPESDDFDTYCTFLFNEGFDEFKAYMLSKINETMHPFGNEKLIKAADFLCNTAEIKYLFTVSKMAEKELKDSVTENLVMQNTELFKEYVVTERKMWEELMRPTAFDTETIKWADDEMIYNDILYRFVTGGEKNFKSLLSAAKIRPDMANVIKAWLNILSKGNRA